MNAAFLRPASAAMLFAFLAASHPQAAIVYPKAPANAQSVVKDYLGRASAGMGVIQDVPVKDLVVGAPHQAWTIDRLQELSAKNFLSLAKPYSWRFLVFHEGETSGAAQLNPSLKKVDGFEIVSTQAPGLAPLFAEAIRKAAKLPRVQKEDYEVRYLNVAPALFVALWLHGKSDDIIIPIGRSFDRWTEGRAYAPEEIAPLVQADLRGMFRQVREAGGSLIIR